MTPTVRVDLGALHIPASPAAVFAAWSDPAALAEWLPPGDATASVEAFDFRPGGGFAMTLTFAGGEPGKTGEGSDRVAARFTVIEPPRLLVLAVGFDSDRPEFAGTMTMRWTFRPVGAGTRVEIACTDVPPGIDALAHEAGLAASLGQLRRYLTPSPPARA